MAVSMTPGHSVHAHALAGDLPVERLAQAHDRGLGRGVRHHPGARHEPRHGRRVHHVRRPALREQPRQEGVQPVHDAHEVDVDERPPVLEGGVGDRTGVADAGVVEQQVERAAGEDLLGQRLHRRRVGHVDGVRDGGAAGGPDLVDDGLRAGQVPVHDVDVRAAGGAQPGEGAADAGRAAGDDGRTTGEVRRAQTCGGPPAGGGRRGTCGGEGEQAAGGGHAGMRTSPRPGLSPEAGRPAPARPRRRPSPGTPTGRSARRARPRGSR